MKNIRNLIIRYRKLIPLVIGIILVVVILVVGIISWRNSVKEKEKIQQGISYLETLEKKDVSEINKKVKAMKAELSLSKALEDENAVWTGFEDAAILGDSRAVGFSYYEFMPSERVLAEKGAIITSVEDSIDELKALNPGLVFICFGLNDLQSNYWPDAESYSSQCAEIIELLTTELPECNVYLNSILPAGEAATDPVYDNIDEYNDSMEAMCEEKGYNFIDNTAMAQEHMDLYEADGLHLRRDFYNHWAMNMLQGVK